MPQIDFGRPVGAEHPPFIITSLDCRELRTIERAMRAIDAAADSSSDAVKLSQLPWGWAARLFEHAERRGIVLLSVALDETAVTRLDWLGAPAFYLVYDWTDLELVACAARTGKPIVMQVGTASHVELAEVIETAQENGHGGIALVQSVIDCELEGLEELSLQHAVVGVADRSQGVEIPLAAISRGACIVEKRFTLRDDNMLCPIELSSVIRDCELAWASLGTDKHWVIN